MPLSPWSPTRTSASARPLGSHRRIAFVATALVLMLTGCSAPAAPVPNAAAPSTTPPSATPTVTRAAVVPSGSTTATKPAGPTITAPKDTRTGKALSKPFTVSGIAVISKQHAISASYRRSSVTRQHGLTKQTQSALARMIAAARAKGVTIRVRSGYRSYALQAHILSRKIREYGSETMARRYNAARGRSEHQSGLAVDLWDGVTWGVGVRNTRTGSWLWANAWRYGFILRYPQGKEKITGYAFEPWHYRWIGVAAAKNFGANTNLTLEEYLGLA